MSWDCQLANAAQHALRRMLKPDQIRVNAALNEMKDDPFPGDTIPLKGEYQGMFRRRVGLWRIVFRLMPAERVVLVADILRRTSGTY